MKKTLFMMILALTLVISSRVFAQDNKDTYQTGTAPDRETIRTMVMSTYDAFSNDNYDKLGIYIDANYIEHSPSPGQAQGLTGLIDFFKTLRTAYPDYKMTVKDVVIDGNKVSVLFNFKGTNTGEMMGMKPTGKSVDVDGLDLMYVNNSGKATEHWGYIDTDKMMQQLGMGMDNTKDHMKKDQH